MARRARTLLMLVTLGALAGPVGPASAGCSSGLPVTDPHAAVYACTGVRVGMTLIVPSRKYGPTECAASFAFTDQFHQRYVAFPGTCYLDFECLEDAVVDLLPPPLDELVAPVLPCLLPDDSELEPYYKRGGPAVTDKDGRRVGAIVYAVNKHSVDFALARVDDTVKLDPSVPLWGGPVRTGTMIATPEEVHVYGPATSSFSLNARSGVLSGGRDVGWVTTEGFTSLLTGSSVLRPDGAAFGFLTGSIDLLARYEVQPLGPGLAEATGRTGLRFRLMTAPLAS